MRDFPWHTECIGVPLVEENIVLTIRRLQFMMWVTFISPFLIQCERSDRFVSSNLGNQNLELNGDVEGSLSATTVRSVGGVGASEVANGVLAANRASRENSAGTLVRRDELGGFSAGTITATLNGNATTANSANSAVSFTGNLTGDITSIGMSTAIANGAVTSTKIADGAVTSAKIADGNISFSKFSSSGCSANQVLRWNGSSWGCSNEAAVDPAAMGGRLTLESNVAVPSSDLIGKQVLYYTPFRSNRVALYGGANWAQFTFSEVSLILSNLSANTNYDVFIYNSSGNLALSLSPWTSDTNRGSNISTQDGVWVKTGDPTQKYVGTIRSTSSSTTEDSANKRFVYNYYHRVKRDLRKYETNTTPWTFTTNYTFTPWFGNLGNRVEVVLGTNEDIVELTFSAYIHGPSSAAYIAIGLDSDTTPTGQRHSAWVSSPTLNVLLARHLGIGYHYLQALIATNGNSATTFGGDGNGHQYGLEGHLQN